MNTEKLRGYARLIARTGAGITEGQSVVIRAELDQPDFVTLLTEECYSAGAAKVRVEWFHQPLTKLHVAHQTLENLSAVTDWETAKMQHTVDTLPCRIFLESEDPNGLDGVDQEKLSRSSQARSKIFKPYRDAMEGKYQWCIAAVPGKAWARKVFPELSEDAAVEALWDAILRASRADREPEAAWQKHNADLKKRCAYLNGLHLTSLHYTAKNGTDFTVGMIPQARFCGGRETTPAGRDYNPNIPSEECFISPMRGVAEGIVYSSKPLSWQGQIIDKFWFRFQNGKVADCGGEQNGDLLQKLIAMDEGAAYLGECALVPWDSPINNTGLLFCNTLFDENACCHLALGMGFADTIEGYHEKSMEEIRKLGVNDSIIHVDFMIGTEDLAIDGTDAAGKVTPIFRNGQWAF